MNINTPFRNARNTENSMFSATNFCISSDKMAVGPGKSTKIKISIVYRKRKTLQIFRKKPQAFYTVPIVISLQLPKTK